MTQGCASHLALLFTHFGIAGHLWGTGAESALRAKFGEILVPYCSTLPNVTDARGGGESSASFVRAASHDQGSGMSTIVNKRPPCLLRRSMNDNVAVDHATAGILDCRSMEAYTRLHENAFCAV